MIIEKCCLSGKKEYVKRRVTWIHFLLLWILLHHTAKNAVISASKLPKAFAASLLDYVGSQAQYLHTLMAITQTGKVESNQHGDRLRRVEMALEALRNVIKHNPGKLKTEFPQYTLLQL